MYGAGKLKIGSLGAQTYVAFSWPQGVSGVGDTASGNPHAPLHAPAEGSSRTVKHVTRGQKCTALVYREARTLLRSTSKWLAALNLPSKEQPNNAF